MSAFLRIAQIGDVHFGAEDREALALARDLIKEDKPDLVVACGDLTQRGKRGEFRAARAFLDSLGVPFLSVPGNHDVPLLDMVARVRAPFERYKAFFGPVDPVCEINTMTIAGINSARGWQARRNWAEGSIDLEDFEAQLNLHKPQVVVAHHPFLQPPNAKLRVKTARGRDAARLAASQGVKLILTGHVHEPTYSTIEHEGLPPVKSISCSTLSHRLRQQPPGLNFIDISDDALNLRSVEFVEGGQRQREETISLPSSGTELETPR